MACRILPRPEHLADARAANDDVYRRLAALPDAAKAEPAETLVVKADRRTSRNPIPSTEPTPSQGPKRFYRRFVARP